MFLSFTILGKWKSISVIPTLNQVPALTHDEELLLTLMISVTLILLNLPDISVTMKLSRAAIKPINEM